MRRFGSSLSERATALRPRAGGAGRGFAAAALLLVLGGCGYSFRSQLPEHLKTIYIPTLSNETSEFQLTQNLTDQLTREFLNRSSLRPGTEDKADAELKGTITGFNERAVNFESGQEVTAEAVRQELLSRAFRELAAPVIEVGVGRLNLAAL